LLFNIIGFGEEIARKLICDIKPLGMIKEYSKLFEFWGAIDDSIIEDNFGKMDHNYLNDDEFQTYQRED
jgi:hypothetical protein